MRDYYLSHIQDVYDYKQELDKVKLPVRIINASQRPRDGTEEEKWKRLNSYFHRGIVPTFSKVSGYLETEAKEILQIMFATVEEHLDYYLVESVAGMSNSRLIEFIESCIQFLVITFGERADKILIENRNKYLQTKKIKK